MGAPEGDKLVPSSSLAMGVSHFDSCGFIAFLILVFFLFLIPLSQTGPKRLHHFNGFVSTQNKLLIIICTTFIQ
jgi:hypothetical protein